MPRDAVSRTANVKRTGRHKWVKQVGQASICMRAAYYIGRIYTIYIYIYIGEGRYKDVSGDSGYGYFRTFL